MQENKYPWLDLKKKQELKFVTVLTFFSGHVIFET